MTGDPNDLYDESIRGIIPRTVDALFAGIQEADEKTEFTLAVQYEILAYFERYYFLVLTDL
jgi:hypothetical protein